MSTELVAQIAAGHYQVRLVLITAAATVMPEPKDINMLADVTSPPTAPSAAAPAKHTLMVAETTAQQHHHGAIDVPGQLQKSRHVSALHGFQRRAFTWQQP